MSLTVFVEFCGIFILFLGADEVWEFVPKKLEFILKLFWVFIWVWKVFKFKSKFRFGWGWKLLDKGWKDKLFDYGGLLKSPKSSPSLPKFAKGSISFLNPEFIV